MCARFEVNLPFKELAVRYRLTGSPPYKRGEVRPTNNALIILADGAHPKTFGLSVDWQASPVINARSETLETKPTFRPLLEQRCIVPCTGWIEWRKEGKARHRNLIKGEETLSLAGLYSDDQFVIVTCAPAQSIAHVHDRMPVVLPREVEAQWIGSAPYKDVAGLLRPFEGHLEAIEDTPAQGSLF